MTLVWVQQLAKALNMQCNPHALQLSYIVIYIYIYSYYNPTITDYSVAVTILFSTIPMLLQYTLDPGPQYIAGIHWLHARTAAAMVGLAFALRAGEDGVVEHEVQEISSNSRDLASSLLGMLLA